MSSPYRSRYPGKLEIARIDAIRRDLIKAKLGDALTAIMPEIRIEDFQELKGGLSGSGVFRVVTTAEFKPLNLSFKLPSMVVKVDRKNPFTQEVKNYEEIASKFPSKKEIFGEIDANRLFQLSRDKNNFFLIMQDLTDYSPLHDVIAKSNTASSELTRLMSILFEVLQTLYSSDKKEESLQENQSGIIKSLYIAKMEQKLRKIIQDKIILIDKLDLKRIRSDFSRIACICEMEPKYLTIMHGDLHDRNIMTRSAGSEPLIKIIDIDNLVFNGDYMYDLGELSASISVVGRIGEIDSAFLTSENYEQFEVPEKAQLYNSLQKTVDAKVLDLSNNIEGAKQDSRYFLSQSRFLLTCASSEKNKAKANLYFNEFKTNLAKSIE